MAAQTIPRHTPTSRSLGRWIAAAALVALVTLGVSGAAIGQASFQQVPAESLDSAQKAMAEKAATATLEAWRSGQPAPLDGFTQKMKTALPPAKQTQAYKQITDRFGDFQSITFAGAVTSPQMPEYTVYRFRGTFSKGRPEVRVVVDRSNKVAGFWIKNWNDTIQ